MERVLVGPPGGAAVRHDERLARVEPEVLSRALKIARLILASDDLAWDAVQESLIRLWIRGTEPSEIGRELAGLVRLSSLHILRCHRRRKLHEELACRDRGSVCCDDDPLLGLEAAEERELLAAASNELAACYRAVFELYQQHGADYSRIAAQLDIPIGTVRSRLSRARSMLEARLLRAGIALDRGAA